MEAQELFKLQYPIGQYECPDTISEETIQHWVTILEDFPNRLELLVKDLTDEQLDTPYRPEGWTIRQVVHHLSDSHHHSYTRFKWTLTEDKPLIKAYFEARWAELFDSKKAPIAMSLNHLKAIHYKLVYLIKGLTREDLQQAFLHPETNTEMSLAYTVGNYAWHSNHHYAHIENLLKRKGWLND